MRLEHLLRLYFSYFIFKILVNIYYLGAFRPRKPEYTKSFLYELFYYASGVIFIFASLRTAKGRLDLKFLPIFLIPLIISSFMKMAVGIFDKVAFLKTPVYDFLESLQILLIVLKFVYPDGMGRWSLVLMFWIVLSLSCMIIACLCALAFVLCFVGTLFGIQFLMKNGRGFIVMGLTFPLITKIVCNFLLLMSFWYLAANNLIGINSDAELPNGFVRRTAIVVIVLNSCLLLNWFMFSNFFGIVPYDYYDYSVKDDLTKHQINWRFTSI